VVQVRQRVSHKKTFLWLEQLIIKHQAHRDVNKMENKTDGIDFFFGKKSHARKFVEFLNNVVPARTSESQKQISHDTKSNIYRFKHTYFVEIIPINRGDLVCLPPKLVSQLGGVPPLMLCWKVSNKLCLLDPQTLKQTNVQNNSYWHFPFRSIASTGVLTLYYVFDVVPTGPREGKFQMCDVTLARESDFGSNDRMYTVRSHLGTILKPGCHAYGYATEGLNFTDTDMRAFGSRQMPEVVLVKRAYVNRKRNRKGRHWQLKTLEIEEGQQTKNEMNLRARDENEFMDELEEDPDYRAEISLYPVPNAAEIFAANQVKTMAMGSDDEDDDDDDDAEDFPDVQLDELISQTDGMKI